MGRSLNEIQDSMLVTQSNIPSLNALEVLTDNEKSTLPNLIAASKVALWRIRMFIMAVGIWSLEQLFDIHKSEIDQTIIDNKGGGVDWYIGIVKEFQFGFSLNNFGEYDNDGVEESALISSKIIKHVSIINVAGTLKIKVAKEDATGNLIKLTGTEVTALILYMKRKGYAGDVLEIISRDADELKLTVDLYFNSQVLAPDGSRLDGTDDTPIQDKIQHFTRQLEFNGELILSRLEDFMELVDGAEIGKIKVAEAKFGANDYALIEERYVPDSGYFNFDILNSEINFKDFNNPA